MQPDDIRKIPIIGLDTKVDGKPIDDVQSAILINTNAFLREVAAQLSEISGHLAQISEEAQTIRNKLP